MKQVETMAKFVVLITVIIELLIIFKYGTGNFAAQMMAVLVIFEVVIYELFIHKRSK